MAAVGPEAVQLAEAVLTGVVLQVVAVQLLADVAAAGVHDATAVGPVLCAAQVVVV